MKDEEFEIKTTLELPFNIIDISNKERNFKFNFINFENTSKMALMQGGLIGNFGISFTAKRNDIVNGYETRA